MPTRTELIITIGEVLECLPPGKSFRRKRYNSFDANQTAAAIEAGNEENVAPPASCLSDTGGMRTRDANGLIVADLEAEPHILTIRRKTRGSSEDGPRRRGGPGTELDGDDEISFNTDNTVIVENGHDNYLFDDDELGGIGRMLNGGKGKGKRKSSAEKFLEDNANYFQLEVLPSKTRSTRPVNGDEGGYHNSFLDFLKSKGVEGKEEPESSDEPCGERARPRSRHKSGPPGSRAYHGARPRASSFHHRSPARSDSEDSLLAQLPRSRSQVRMARSRSRARSISSRHLDGSPSGSEVDAIVNKKQRTPKKRIVKAADSSEDESDTEKKSRSSSRGVSRSRRKGAASSSSPSPSKKARRSELDKLLEAVDTSFHFETAAAAAKRLSGSPNLGPLEIDVSDSNCESENSDLPLTVRKKRKISESDLEVVEKKPVKKLKGAGVNNLLKTLSPGPPRKKIAVKEESDSENGDECPVWDGWNELNETLAGTDSSAVPIDDLHFSFEATPKTEGWFQTYSRQDAGEDCVYYPESRGFPFPLPYEMPLSFFMPYKTETKEKIGKNGGGSSSKTGPKKPTDHVAKFKKRKLSDCESTDSSDSGRKGKGRLGTRMEHLIDSQHRVSPRCHASTKDERELNYPGMLMPFQLIDETSNDSMCSIKSRPVKRESIGDYLQLAASLDKFFRQPDEFDPTAGGRTDDQASSSAASLVAAKANNNNNNSQKDRTPEQQPTVPTRSRVSSEELLRTKKEKRKKTKDRSFTSDQIMDQVVQGQVDAVLLDCLEDELPTVPFEGASSSGSELLSLLDTYQACMSMNVCNSRWLRPSRPAVLGGDEGTSSSNNNSNNSGRDLLTTKKSASQPFKPKRLVIYKEDLPGFKFDNDIEVEKLPVSRRCLAKSGATQETPAVVASTTEKDSVKKETSPLSSVPPKSTKKKGIKREVFVSRKEKEEPAPVIAVKSEPPVGQDDDTVSVGSDTSSSSRKKGRRKVNKTGFPTPKKKKKSEEREEETPPKQNKKSADPAKKKLKQSLTKSEVIKSSNTKQLKMEKFLVKTKKVANSPSSTKSSPNQAKKTNNTGLGKRSTTLQAKNYSELESDTESLFESKVPYRSPHMKVMPLPSKKKAAAASHNKSRHAK